MLVATWFRHRAEGRLHEAAEAPAGRPVVLLGARPGRDGRPTALLEARIRTAAAVSLRSGTAPLLVSGDGRPAYDEVGVMLRRLRELGLGDEKLRVDDGSTRTLASLRFALDEFGGRPVLLVSQRDHLQRALFLADGLGLPAEGVVASEVRRSRRSLVRAEAREAAARLRALIDVVGVRR